MYKWLLSILLLLSLRNTLVAALGLYPKYMLQNDEYVVRNPFHDFYMGRTSMEEMINQDYMCHHFLYTQLSHLKKGVRCADADFAAQLKKVTEKCCRDEFSIGCRFRDLVPLGCNNNHCMKRCEKVPDILEGEIADVLRTEPEGPVKTFFTNITDYLDVLPDVLGEDSAIKERNSMLLQHLSFGKWHPSLLKNLVRDIMKLPVEDVKKLVGKVMEENQKTTNRF